MDKFSTQEGSLNCKNISKYGKSENWNMESWLVPLMIYTVDWLVALSTALQVTIHREIMPLREVPWWGEVDEQAFRPQWQFEFQAHFDKWFGLPQCLKTYHLSPYNIKKDMLTGPFAMLSMPSFDFHLPPCMEGFLIHLSPLWQLPLWQLPLFPSVAQFPCVCLNFKSLCLISK